MKAYIKLNFLKIIKLILIVNPFYFSEFSLIWYFSNQNAPVINCILLQLFTKNIS